MAQNNDRNSNDKRNAQQQPAAKGKQPQARNIPNAQSQKNPAHREWSTNSERNSSSNSHSGGGSSSSGSSSSGSSNSNSRSRSPLKESS